MAHAEFDHVGLGGALLHFRVLLDVTFDQVDCGFQNIRRAVLVQQKMPLWEVVGRKAVVTEFEHVPSPGCTCLLHGQPNVRERCFTVHAEVELIEKSPAIPIPTPLGTLTIPGVTLSKLVVEIDMKVCEGGATQVERWITVDDAERKAVGATTLLPPR